MRAIFVTGTDTDAGKSTICALLARFLKQKGYSAVIQKWIKTGCGKEQQSYKLPYAFKFASSPHLAAKLEGRKINKDRIKKGFMFLLGKFDSVIVEGIGGVLVPFSKNAFVIDIAKELKLPVIIVAQNKLGAINHTLLTIEAIKRRNMKIIGIIFNNISGKENKIILKDNPQIIKKLTGENVLGVLPYSKDKDKLYKAFSPIGDKILRHCERTLK